MSSLELEDVDFGEHGVIYITSDKDKPLLTEWTKPATAELLRALPKQYEAFNVGKISSKRRLYEYCAQQLERKGFQYTTAQCENKWKSLKRRYLSKYEALLQGKPMKGPLKPRQLFDNEIEVVLKLEKPSFKTEIDAISRINLNIPPGFVEKSEPNDLTEEENEEEYNEEYGETEEQEYTQSDAKLVEMVLKDSNPLDEEGLSEPKEHMFANNVEYLYSNPEGEETMDEEKYAPFMMNINSDNKLVREMRELRKVVKRCLDSNTNLLKNSNATHEQILMSLDMIEKREEEKLDIKRKKLEKQGELIQQVKIQNSLIAKLIQKLGNNSAYS